MLKVSILDSIIALWKGVEYAEVSNQPFTFLKIDFDKPYDRLEWSFILDSLSQMGLNPPYLSYVKTLFGNARARVAVNGYVTSPLALHKSIGQGCPLAPLLYAIAADGFSFLVQQKMDTNPMQGIRLPNGDQMCLQLFVDDNNALISSDINSIQTF